MFLRRSAVSAALGLIALTGTAGAQSPSPEFALKYRPTQDDVEYDRPAPEDVKKCKVDLERTEEQSGFAVYDPDGLILRRYVDSNKDRYIDQWRYYRNGIEVYRDLDTDFNHKADQCRWLNTDGSRWGIDESEDGQIERWKWLSAEEASRVAISAMASGDAELLATVLVTPADLKSIGLSENLMQKLLQQVQEPEAALRTVTSGSQTLTRESKWSRFDGAMPGVIPADQGKATQDLIVYEGAMAIIETGGEHGFVQLGEMIRVGDVWKLTRIPKPVEGDAIQIEVGGVLMQPETPSGTAPQDITPEMQELISELQAVDQKAPAQEASPETLLKYLKKRTAIIERIVAAARPGEEADTWRKQLVNSLSSAIQAGDKSARAKLDRLLADLKQRAPESPLVAYAEYRKLFADYSVDAEKASGNEQQQKVQKEWLQKLRGFIDKYPTAEDAPDALLQLALNAEFSRNAADARSWYRRLVENYSESPQAVRARGALRRMDLKGQPLELSGPTPTGREVSVSNLKGRVVLVVFWASWSNQFVSDVPVLRALYEQYNDRGFEIVGVSLARKASDVTEFTSEKRIKWPNIFQPGGLDSPLAEKYGLVTVPTMFLVGRDGRVISNRLTTSDLKERLAAAFRKQ